MPVSTDPQTEHYLRVLVWGGWFRLAHWSIALSTLALITSGWLLAESPSLAQAASEYHYLAAGVLLFGLLLRSLLMFVGKPHEKITGLVVDPSEFRIIASTFRFYLSPGRAALPNWYAQNPLWKTLYLGVYLLLYIQAISGVLMTDNDMLFGFYLPSVHAWWAQVIVYFTVLHAAAVVLHDLKGRAADISAMINGHRLFRVGGDANRQTDGRVQLVSLDRLKK